MKISSVFLIVIIALAAPSHSRHKYRKYAGGSSPLPNFWQSAFTSKTNNIDERYSNIGAYGLRNPALISSGRSQDLAEQVANQVVQATVLQVAQEAAQEVLERTTVDRVQAGQEAVEGAVQKVAQIAAVSANQANPLKGSSTSSVINSQAAEIAATIARPIIQQAVTEAAQIASPIGSLNRWNDLSGLKFGTANRVGLYNKISPELDWYALSNVDKVLPGGIASTGNQQQLIKIVVLRAVQLAARQSAKVAFQQALQLPEPSLLGASNIFESSNIQQVVPQIVQESVQAAVQQTAYYLGLATPSSLAQQNYKKAALWAAQEAALKAAQIAAQIGFEKAAELKLKQNQFGMSLNPLAVVAQQKAAEQIAIQVAEQVIANKVSEWGTGGAAGYRPIAWNRNVAGTELVAEQVADKIVQESEFKQENKVQEAIQDIANKRQRFADLQFLQPSASSPALPLIQQLNEGQTLQAIQDLQRQNQQQQIASIKPKQDLENTLQALIQAQITSENAPATANIFAGNAVYDDQKLAKFNAQLQELVTQNNIEQTKKTIAQAESEAKQLEQQRQLVDKEKQKIEAQQNAIGQWRVAPRQAVLLDRAQERLYAREQQLLQELLAQQLVIQQLQQVLIEQRNELQSNIVADKIDEDAAQLRKYSYKSL